MEARPFDAAKAEAFRGRLRELLNGAGLALLLSIGHRTGLFDVLRRMDPAPSEAIAEKAGLDARYVRAWLGAMAAGGIVVRDARTGSYQLPAEHAAALTRDARPQNRAAAFQWIPVLAGVEDRIVECFERGGGVPRGCFGRLRAVLAEQGDQTVVAVLLEAVLPLVPGAPEALERGSDVLDVGCGSGRALNRMAAAYRRSRFTGIDLSPAAVAAARTEACELGLRNVRFEVRDVEALDARNAFDLVTAFGVVGELARPEAALRAVARALRPEGALLVQDAAGAGDSDGGREHPLAPFLQTLACLHQTPLAPADDAGGPGAGDRTLRALGAAGFARVECRRLPHDLVNEYRVARKGP